MNTKYLQSSILSLACVTLSLAALTSNVNGANVQRSHGKTIVSGTISRGGPAHQTPGAHLHIDLVNAKGQVIESATRSVAVTAPRKDASRNYRSSYSVRFDSVEGTSARVRFINTPHGECGPKNHCASC